MQNVILGVLVAAALIAVPSSAQEQSASIQGLVKDSQGGVLPGVTVDARNAQGAVASTVADDRGAYRFPSLLPGKYDVTAQLASFNTYKVEGVELLLGQMKTVDFTLQLAGVAEEVVVKGEAPLVDTRQSAGATSIAREQIDLLPKGRDFTSLVTQAPGANSEGKSNGLMIDGATASENRYIVDGAETSNWTSAR
jgi:Carboxypeptidase regulatory-like domain